MIPIGTPRALVYRVRRPPAPVASAPDVADADVDRVLGPQWCGVPAGVEAGWPALARALLACACLDSGIVRRRGPGGLTPTVRETARRYLLEADPDVPLPLEVACGLARLDVTRVRAVVRLSLP
jgi:hypothetical protein